MNDSPIMRRCKDNWVNATQILKCCNFPKAKRTKILEKGVQQGQHEKVQGGFGRFQGTWIPLEDAQKLARNYGVTQDAAPVLFLDFSDPNLHIPEKAKPLPKEPSSIKRKYTKRPKNPDEDQSPKKYKTGKKAAAQAAAAAAAAVTPSINGGIPSSQGSLPPNSQDSYGSISRSNSYIPSSQSQNGNGIQLPPTFSQASQQPPVSMPINGSMPINYNTYNTQNEYQNHQLQLQRIQQQQQYQIQQQQQQQQQQLQLQLQQQQQQQQQKFYQTGVHQQMVRTFQQSKSLSQSTNDTNWSQDDNLNNHNHKDSDTSVTSNEDSKINDITQSPKSLSEDSYSSLLLKFFSEDNSEIPYFLHNPPFDFNINEPIDDEGHTPLHWAASIGNYQMIHLLLSKGASPLVVNNFGLNPLSKLISFNNCYELKNFPKVLDDLDLCLINTDINGRTPLHYLCQFVKVKTKYESLRYYLNIILNKLSDLSNQSLNKQVNLLRNVLDHQDVNGDTCCHLAAKSNSPKILKTLLQYGARDDLENIHKETTRTLIMQHNIIPNYVSIPHNPLAFNYSPPSGPPPPVPVPITHIQQKPQPIPQTQPAQPQQPYLVMATPVQPSVSTSETPDTQRTTIQELDEDDDDRSDRVDRSHLDALIKSEDNKENIFMEHNTNSNFHKNMSTPRAHAMSPHLHQPLAVISERTVESTPISNDTKKSAFNSNINNNQFHHAHQPNPPKLNDDGEIIENDEDSQVKDDKLSMIDLSTMISGMINALSTSYKSEITKLDTEKEQLQKSLNDKEHTNEHTFNVFVQMLSKSGVEQFNTIEEGEKLLLNEIANSTSKVEKQQSVLLRRLERDQAFHLASLVEEQELKYMDKEGNKDNNSTADSEDVDLINEDKIDYALELSQLQTERVKLIQKLAINVTNYGIDEKMYKYRKLISSSCGLKVEDIDSLIDGIEESLVENL
ncbi:hypothetical protein DFJ63DRAFT_312123 [Scheffersomyces coipomensis]|uniref:uncharacterized protein n=1 Tax=Scheffersomyces coipomensis TaxID=1788519 RepID=UPI00315D63BB